MKFSFGFRAVGHGNHGRSAATSAIRSGQAVFPDRLAGERSIGSSPPGPSSASEPAQGDQWLESWQRNEIRWLRTRVEELEGQLRWRTITLGSALALSTLTAGTAAGWAVLYGDNPAETRATLATPGAEQVAQIATSAERATSPGTGSPLDEPVASLPAEGDAEQAVQLWALQAERAPEALAEEASPGHTAVDSTSMRAEEVALGRPSATDEALTEVAAERTAMPQASAFEPAAGTAPGQHEEPTWLKAGRRDTAALGSARDRQEYYMSTTPASLRTAPTAEAAALAVVPEGDLVKLIGRERSWLHVEYSDADAESATGWMHIDYLRRIPRPEEDGP